MFVPFFVGFEFFQVDVVFRPPIAVALIIIVQPTSQRLVGNLLQMTVYRCENLIAIGVSLVPVALEHFVTHHFRRIGRIKFDHWEMQGDIYWLGNGCIVLRFVNEL